MSSALVRQALDFVDPEESSLKRKKRGGARQSSSGQGAKSLQLDNKKTKNNNLKKKKKAPEKDEQVDQEIISKLLKLSKPTIDKKLAGKIVKRAVTGKPVGDKIKVKKSEPEKSILFPEDNFKQFEKDPFCR